MRKRYRLWKFRLSQRWFRFLIWIGWIKITRISTITTIQNAIDQVEKKDLSHRNRVIIEVGPGVYQESLTAPDFVTVQGVKK